MKMLAMLALLMAILVACSANSDVQQTSGRKADTASAIVRTLIIGSGGGFTGIYRGYRICSDGRVYAWSAPAGGRDTGIILFTDADSVEGFFRVIDEMKFQQVDYNDPGNMNWYVELQQGEQSHRVQWSTSPPAGAIAEFHRKVSAWAAGHSKESEAE
ncbi:MAG: hypothetical protein IPM61_07140 [Chlorobi bacterium]|nr:hypothetical protein [Chlorobiota bacterium]